MIRNSALFAKHLQPLLPIPTGLVPAASLSTPIKGILFDIYGTLFISDSGDISHAQKKMHRKAALNTLFQKYRIPRSVDEVLDAFFEAIHTTHTKLKVTGIDFPEIEIDRIWVDVLNCDDQTWIKRFAIEFELIVNPVYPMPHLKELLSICRDKNMMMGIISNAQFFTPMLFSWFLGLKPVELGFHPGLTIYSYEFAYAKPSLFLYRTAIERATQLGFTPDTLLYVGNDMLNDIYPANKLGFKTALFAGDNRSLRLRKDDPRCRNLTPDLIITDLIQLTPYIKLHP